MEIAVRIVDDVAILDAIGVLDGDGGRLVRGTVESLLREGHRKFVLNLEGVSPIDRGGLGEIAQIYSAMPEGQV